MAQLSVAVALINGLSLSALAVGFSLLQNTNFRPGGKRGLAFTLSFPLLLLAAFLSSGAIISRTLDFRLTARKVRKKQHADYSRSLTLFGLGPECYGRITWTLFWLGCVALLLGVTSLVASIALTFRTALWAWW